MGVSMGGLGAAYLGGRLPGYFGSVAVYSGFVDHQRPEITNGGLQAVTGVDYPTVFGPSDGYYATAHNPARTAENLATQRVLVTVGDGTPDPALDEDNPVDQQLAGGIERENRAMNDTFVGALDKAGVKYRFVPHAGTHSWPYWRKDVRTAIDWGLFAPVAGRPARWANATVAQRGDRFGVRDAVDSPPDGIVRFTAAGRRLRGEGATGARVLLTTARGCRVRVNLPFDVKLPARRCGRKGKS
jgi:hypothetical protein